MTLAQYSKTCVERSLSKKTTNWFSRPIFDQREHPAILSTFIKLPFVIKIFVLSIFEWPFYTGLTVPSRHIMLAKSILCTMPMQFATLVGLVYMVFRWSFEDIQYAFINMYLHNLFQSSGFAFLSVRTSINLSICLCVHLTLKTYPLRNLSKLKSDDHINGQTGGHTDQKSPSGSNTFYQPTDTRVVVWYRRKTDAHAHVQTTIEHTVFKHNLTT